MEAQPSGCVDKQELLREPETFLEQKSASETRILNSVAKAVGCGEQEMYELRNIVPKQALSSIPVTRGLSCPQGIRPLLRL